jgi:GNAT superfamily N-acetyltransferase
MPSPVKRRIAVGAFVGPRCMGAMLFELPLLTDREVALVQVAVPAQHRRRGVATALWAWAGSRARSEGRTIIQSEVYLPYGTTTEEWPGSLFAVFLGFTIQNVEDHLVLDLPVPSDVVEGLVWPISGNDYEITAWVGACPDEYVHAWAELHTAMSVDVPTGGLTRGTVAYTVERVRTDERRMAPNWISLHSMALTRDGVPVGYSTIYLPLGAPEHAHQDDTLVLHSHRGHGLGTRLKAANLRQLAGLPATDVSRRRWLHAYTAQDNMAMQRVNSRFGFQPIETMYEYEKGPSAD